MSILFGIIFLISVLGFAFYGETEKGKNAVEKYEYGRKLKKGTKNGLLLLAVMEE